MKWLGWSAVVLALGFAAACGNDHSNPTGPSSGAAVKAVTVTSASTSGSSFQMTATAQLADGSSRDVTTAAQWQSSNTKIATVSASGVLTVVGAGEVDVRATYQNVTGSAHLILASTPVVSLAVTGAPASPASSFQLTATAKMSDGSTSNVTDSASWQSSNTQIATVSSTGFVTATGTGQVDITAAYGGVSGTAHAAVTSTAAFTISGVVTEVAPNAHPVAGARVQLLVGAHAFTDDHGAFSLGGVPPGRTLLEVTADGYQVWEQDAEVTDHDVKVDIQIYPKPPTNADGATATARCKDGSWSWASTQAEACTANGGVAYAVCPGPLCTQ